MKHNSSLRRSLIPTRNQSHSQNRTRINKAIFTPHKPLPTSRQWRVSNTSRGDNGTYQRSSINASTQIQPEFAARGGHRSRNSIRLCARRNTLPEASLPDFHPRFPRVKPDMRVTRDTVNYFRARGEKGSPSADSLMKSMKSNGNRYSRCASPLFPANFPSTS